MSIYLENSHSISALRKYIVADIMTYDKTPEIKILLIDKPIKDSPLKVKLVTCTFLKTKVSTTSAASVERKESSPNVIILKGIVINLTKGPNAMDTTNKIVPA